jgi:hypothetical protein
MHDLSSGRNGGVAWELQAPLTVRPSKLEPFPAKTDWRVERAKMKKVCLQCHAQQWVDAHFSNLDTVVSNYNEQFYKLIKAMIDCHDQTGFLSKRSYR